MKKINISNPPKVLLLRPPQLFYYSTWPVGPRLSVPTGLLAIGSYLEMMGIKVEIYDSFIKSKRDKAKKENKEVLKSSNFINRWIKQFESTSSNSFKLSEWVSWINRPSTDMSKNTHHFGSDWKTLEKDICDSKADIIGITNLFRENTEETIKTIKIARKALPNSVIVVGGPNATAMPEYILERAPELDILGLGDGEKTMMAIVKWNQGKGSLKDIKGIIYREDNKLIHTPAREWVTQLDELGNLNYNLIQLENYFQYERSGIMARNKFEYNNAEKSVSLITSRGCPYKCSFCSIHIHAGRKFRRYSVHHTLNHLEDLVNNYGVKHIHFEDDNLTLDKDRFMELMNGILKRNLKFTWDTPNGVFANNIDKDMLNLMKKTGCIYLIIGVESGDQWVLDNIIYKQPLTLEHVKRVFKLAKEIKLDIRAFYIIGFPRETLENIQSTLKYAINALRKYDIIPQLAIARADPGTDMYSEAERDGKLFSTNIMSSNEGSHVEYFIRNMITNEHFTPELLEKLSIKFHRSTIFIIGYKTILYHLKNPKIAYANIKFLFRIALIEKIGIYNSIIRLFFSRLFFPHAMKREYYYDPKL